MNAKLLLTIHGVVYGLFAIVLFFIPDILWPLYGLQVNDEFARFLSQHNSIFLGGLAIIAILFRSLASNDQASRTLVQGFLFTNILGIVITLYAGAIGVFSEFGWSDPVFFLVLSILCALTLRQIPKAT